MKKIILGATLAILSLASTYATAGQFNEGEFCNGSTIVHWECGDGARGAVYQGNGCYHTDTGYRCSSHHQEPSTPFTQGEFCNGRTIVHWECGDGARGSVPQPYGCYHTDTGRRCH